MFGDIRKDIIESIKTHMDFKPDIKRLTFLSSIHSGLSIMSFIAVSYFLIIGDYDSAVFFLVYGVITLPLLYFAFKRFNTYITLDNEGLRCNQIKTLGFVGFIGWELIQNVTFGQRYGIKYIDLNISPEYIRRGLGHSKKLPDCLYERNIRVFTGALNIKNSDLAALINKRLSYKKTKGTNFDFFNTLHKIMITGGI